MCSKKLNNTNENSELKTFLANMRSGSLIKLIESNHIQFEEKCNYLSQKLKNSEEEVQSKISILQQNALLIEKFQKKLYELSDQNSGLLDEQQTLKEENEHLLTQLQCSEDKFSQLDILYDQKITDLSEKNNEIEQKLDEFQTSQKLHLGQFARIQTDLKEMVTRAEQRTADLQIELNDSQLKHQTEMEELTDKLSSLQDDLNRKTIDYEEKIQDLQTSLSAALEENKEILELKNELEDMQNERKEDLNSFNIDKTLLISAKDSLKTTLDDHKKRLATKDKIIEDLKKKLATKEKEVEELYLKCKQITRNNKQTSTSQTGSNSMLSGKLLINTQVSPGDPKPLEESSSSSASSDSSDSSINGYKYGKRRRPSDEFDQDELFYNLRDSKPDDQQSHYRIHSYAPKKKMIKILDNIEIPESPIVSSSAFEHYDKK